MAEEEQPEEPVDWKKTARGWQGLYYDVLGLAERMQETNKSILRWAWTFLIFAAFFWGLNMFLAHKMDELEDYKDRCEASCPVAEAEVE